MGVPAYIRVMFVRKKPNSSGIISVQIIDKSSGSYRMVKTIGSSSDPEEVKHLVREGKEWIRQYGGQQVLDFRTGDDTHFIKVIESSIQEVQLLGPELILGRIFDEIGFNQIPEDLFRQSSLVWSFPFQDHRKSTWVQ